MGFRFSARRTCNFQGQIRCDNIFPSRTLNCNSKLLTIKIKLAKESFTGLCFSKSFIIQIKSIYSLFTKLNLMFWFPIEDIYRFSNSYEKMNSHSKILFLTLFAGALQKMYLNVVWWMICLLVNELTKLKGRRMMCWWASLILLKAFENISQDFSFVLYVGSVSFWFCISYYVSLLEFPKAEAAESIIHLPCVMLVRMTICRKQNSRNISSLNLRG